MKEHVNVPVPQNSDVGQLLFYMLDIYLNCNKNEQHYLGIYIEGEHVSYYLNDKGVVKFGEFGISIAIHQNKNLTFEALCTCSMAHGLKFAKLQISKI